jgi:hypothetical protein
MYYGTTIFMETTEKQLKGPRASAIKSIQLLIYKNLLRRNELTKKAGILLGKAQDLDTENEGLEEQIKRLKGE